MERQHGDTILPGDSVSRYDPLLAAIALLLVVAGVSGALLPVGMAVAFGAGSVPATGTMGYALFYRPPGEHGIA